MFLLRTPTVLLYGSACRDRKNPSREITTLRKMWVITHTAFITRSPLYRWDRIYGEKNPTEIGSIFCRESLANQIIQIRRCQFLHKYFFRHLKLEILYQNCYVFKWSDESFHICVWLLRAKSDALSQWNQHWLSASSLPCYMFLRIVPLHPCVHAPSKQETFTQCCFNAGPASTTPGQH